MTPREMFLRDAGKVQHRLRNQITRERQDLDTRVFLSADNKRYSARRATRIFPRRPRRPALAAIEYIESMVNSREPAQIDRIGGVGV